MKRTDFTLQGGFPLSQDRLKEMQDTYFEAVNALTLLAGNNCIVYGCAENGTNVAAGWVVIGSELLPFRGGTKNTYIGRKETVSNTLQYADGSNKNVVFEKEAVFTATASGAVKWADMKRVSDLLVQKTALDALSTSLSNLATEVGKKVATTDFSAAMADRVIKYIDVYSFRWYIETNIQNVVVKLPFKFVSTKHAIFSTLAGEAYFVLKATLKSHTYGTDGNSIMAYEITRTPESWQEYPEYRPVGCFDLHVQVQLK